MFYRFNSYSTSIFLFNHTTNLILSLHFTETDNHITQSDNCQSDHENGLDIENDDDYPLMSDLDVADHDPNDMNRPRKIRR